MFGPKPRSYRIELPKKIRRLARQSAFNQRANEGRLFVIEALDFDTPKTRDLGALLEKLGVGEQKVLLLTNGTNHNVYLSGRNMPRVSVLAFEEASAYEVLWSGAVVVERDALTADAGKGKEASSE